MKKKILLIMSLLAVLGIISMIIMGIEEKKEKNKEEKKQVATPDDGQVEEEFTDGYTFYEAEIWVSYLAKDQEEEKALGRLVDPLTKSEFITVQYITDVVNVIGAPESVYQDVILDMNPENYLTKLQFDVIYDNIVDLGTVENLRRANILIYDVRTYVSEEGANKVEVFDGNQYYNLVARLSKEYADCIVDVYVKGEDIYRINGLGKETVVFPNAWLISIENGNCTFLYNGFTKTYPIIHENWNIDEDSIVKLTIDNTGVTDIDKYTERLRCKVLDVGNGVLELENVGNIPYVDNIKIYDISNSNNPFCEDSITMLKGHSEVLIVRDGYNIIGAVIEDEAVTRDIRVILSNNTYSSYKMPSVTFSCDTSYEISYSDGSSSVKNADKSTTIQYDDYKKGDVITIKPKDNDGKILIHSLERGYGNPVYSGIIEIRILEDGLHIINQVPLETYLYSVVASEMPAGGHIEALKALAVCARGYAYTKMEDGSFDSYEAHLDDSSLCQVYNNVEVTEDAIRAVKDTYGLVPVYKDALIVPLYFSTSCGTTCTNVEIWGGTEYPYFQSNLETHEKESIDLSEEETFKQFLDNSLGYDIIDKEMPYYRWNVTFTKSDMTEAINSMLKERMSVSSEYIKEVDEDGKLHSTDITDIGQIKNIQVIERSISGVVNVLQIEGTLATIQVSGQTNVRNIITPINQQIVRQDGNVVTGWTSLPSPYYYVEQTEDGFVVYGGGFGHGVGMSQSGAEILAKEGYNYKYILRHYYSYIDFSSIYIIESKKDE